MFTITKQFSFSASHILEGLPEGHPCGRMHGHNYVIEVELAGPLNPVGFVVDYNDLKPIQEWIDITIDHRHLNNVLAGNPTAEHLAAHLYETFRPRFPTLVAVRVSETPKTWAEYRP